MCVSNDEKSVSKLKWEIQEEEEKKKIEYANHVTENNTICLFVTPVFFFLYIIHSLTQFLSSLPILEWAQTGPQGKWKNIYTVEN